jgi:hypothetical protein
VTGTAGSCTSLHLCRGLSGILCYADKMLGASGSALGSDTPAGTSGGQAEPTIASELDTFNVALNKQLQVITHAG